MSIARRCTGLSIDARKTDIRYRFSLIPIIMHPSNALHPAKAQNDHRVTHLYARANTSPN